MSLSVICTGSEFKIKKENEGKAKISLTNWLEDMKKDEYLNKLQWNPEFENQFYKKQSRLSYAQWIDKVIHLSRSFRDMFYQLGLQPKSNNQYCISKIKLWNTQISKTEAGFFANLAPFIEPGCFIDYVEHTGCPVRLYFDGNKMIVQDGKISFKKIERQGEKIKLDVSVDIKFVIANLSTSDYPTLDPDSTAFLQDISEIEEGAFEDFSVLFEFLNNGSYTGELFINPTVKAHYTIGE